MNQSESESSSTMPPLPPIGGKLWLLLLLLLFWLLSCRSWLRGCCHCQVQWRRLPHARTQRSLTDGLSVFEGAGGRQPAFCARRSRGRWRCYRSFTPSPRHPTRFTVTVMMAIIIIIIIHAISTFGRLTYITPGVCIQAASIYRK